MRAYTKIMNCLDDNESTSICNYILSFFRYTCNSTNDENNKEM